MNYGRQYVDRLQRKVPGLRILQDTAQLRIYELKDGTIPPLKDYEGLPSDANFLNGRPGHRKNGIRLNLTTEIIFK